MKNSKIVLLFLISTLSQFPLSMIRFIVPIQAKDLGANFFILGLMGMAYGLVYILLAGYFGKISEKFGHKRMIYIGLLLYAIVILLYLMIKNPLFFIFIRGGEAIGMAMVWPSIEAFSQFAHEKRIEHSVMVYTLSWSMAASLAPYIGALFIKDFAIAILLIFSVSIAGSIVSYLLPVKNYAILEERKNYEVNLFFEILIPIFIYGFNSSVVLSFYPAFGLEANLNAYYTGIIMTVSGIFMIIAFLFSGLFFYKMKKHVLILGFLLQLLFFFTAYNFSFIVQIISLSGIYFGEGLIYYNVLFNIVKSFQRNVGSKTGLFETSIGLGSVLGPLIGGLPTIFGLRFPWIASFAASLAVFIIYIIYIIYNKIN
ncbi:MAG: MFS transporter [Thermoplasmata archaeon]|nr:MFS transporter [Thermoplasmata archaeon]